MMARPSVVDEEEVDRMERYCFKASLALSSRSSAWASLRRASSGAGLGMRNLFSRILNPSSVQ